MELKKNIRQLIETVVELTFAGWRSALTFILSEGNFYLRFISMYSVLNKLSEFVYSYISKTLLRTLLLLVFKIVESLYLERNGLRSYYIRI